MIIFEYFTRKAETTYKTIVYKASFLLNLCSPSTVYALKVGPNSSRVRMSGRLPSPPPPHPLDPPTPQDSSPACLSGSLPSVANVVEVITQIVKAVFSSYRSARELNSYIQSAIRCRYGSK
ncbi:hypothetical protein J6590_012274 [Homalodisca vitripennis]|nr:hypothetical protein J6590_012274 [Homalodisca vitripennis]